MPPGIRRRVSRKAGRSARFAQAAVVRTIGPRPALVDWTSTSSGQYGRSQHALRHINAALEEQARAIGQALHDEAAQFLTAAHTALAFATELAAPPVRDHLAVVKNHLDTIEEQLRRIAYELRPSILDDLGLIPAIRSLAQAAELRRGISVAFVARVNGPFPTVVETAVYRMIQEGVSNVTRHSGATRVVLELEESLGVLHCRIRDNGVGFKAAAAGQPSSGLGLRGIRDRMSALGAELTIHSAPDGTELVADIPLEVRHERAHSAR